MTYVDAYAYDKPSVLLPRKGSIEKRYYVEEPFWTVDTIYYTVIDDSLVLPKYLYYVATTLNMSRFNKAGGVPSLTQGDWTRQMIPLPPRPVQDEIVKALDAMDAVVKALEEERNARFEQFEAMRDKLLKFANGGYHKIAIDKVCVKTMNVQWKGNAKTYRYIDLSSVDRETHLIGGTMEITSENAPSRAQQIVCVGDVLFATTRPTQMRLCIVPLEYDGQICSTGYVVLRANVDLVNPRWIYYQLYGDEFCRYCEHNQIRGGAYPSITNASVKAYEITMPPRNVQDEVIKSLDAFLAVVIALDEEIAARREQFAGWLEKLMKFKEAA